MIKTSDSPGAKTKMKRLTTIVNDYDFEDVSKAIYCICVCVNNRSALESTLSLNWALVEHSHKGQKKIKDYDDLKDKLNNYIDILMQNKKEDDK